MIDFIELKRRNPIVDVLKERGYQLTGRGKYWHLDEHDSCVINTDKQVFHWNSRGLSGSIIDWLIEVEGLAWDAAIDYLCRRAGIERRMTAAQKVAAERRYVAETALTVVGRYFVDRLWRVEADGKPSTGVRWGRGRGWSDAVMRAEGCGFWDGDYEGLRHWCRERGVDAEHPVVVSVVGYRGDVAKWGKRWGVAVEADWVRDGNIYGMPRGEWFVYGAWAAERMSYFAMRNCDPAAEPRNKHRKPKVAMVGEQEPFFNSLFRPAGNVVIVEGQADAVALAAMDVAAVAIGGLANRAGWIEMMVKRLSDCERVYVGVDGDAAGWEALGQRKRGKEREDNQLAQLVAALGPMTRIVTWPATDGAKDAADLVKAGISRDEMLAILGKAVVWPIYLCERATNAPVMEREEAIDRAVRAVAKLDNYNYEKLKKACADMLPAGIGIRELNNMRSVLIKGGHGASKTELKEVPNGHVEGHLFELCYQPEHEDGARTFYAVRYPDGTIGTANWIETDNYIIRPPEPMDSIIKTGVIKLPTGLERHGGELALMGEIRAFINQYVDLPEHMEIMAAYYVMMTWVYDAFYVLPYLRARGLSDSGKSRFTETVGHLCFRATLVSGSSTTSPVFRLNELWNGLTVVVDEADLPGQDADQDWMKMLNVGYKRGNPILRTNIGNGEAKVEAFDAFGPKVINMRGRFGDDATESRCLTWETSSGRAVRDDIPRYMDREAFEAAALRIRNKLLRWRLEAFSNIKVDYNHEATKHLPGRLVEITVSLMSISTDEAFKAHVFEFMAKMNERAVMERSSTLEAKVFEGLLRARFEPDAKAREELAALPDDASTDERRLAELMSVGHIARHANRLINMENDEASLLDDDGDDEKENAVRNFDRLASRKNISPRKIASVLSTGLNLERAKNGWNRRTFVPWEQNYKRIEALIVRFGLEELFMELVAKEMVEPEAAKTASGPAQLAL